MASARALRDWILIGGFAAALVLPTVGELLGPSSAAGVLKEKRNPAPRPELGLDGGRLAAFPAAYERWYADHFGFRTALIRWHNAVVLLGFGVEPNDRVLLGKEGWIFLGEPLFLDYYRALDPFTDCLLYTSPSPRD